MKKIPRWSRKWKKRKEKIKGGKLRVQERVNKVWLWIECKYSITKTNKSFLKRLKARDRIAFRALAFQPGQLGFIPYWSHMVIRAPLKKLPECKPRSKSWHCLVCSPNQNKIKIRRHFGWRGMEIQFSGRVITLNVWRIGLNPWLYTQTQKIILCFREELSFSDVFQGITTKTESHFKHNSRYCQIYM